MLHLAIMLLASGGVTLCSHSSRDYYLVTQSKSWSAAKTYCRQTYTDLAIVESVHDATQLQNLAKERQVTGRGWIGLIKTQVASWAWSVAEDQPSLEEYTNWATSPGISNLCGAMMADGKWQASPCSTQLPFVCQSGGPNRMFTVLAAKTWAEAKEYCRLHGNDLVSVRSRAENEAVQQLIREHGETHSSFWIGLFTSKLKRSGKGYNSFSYWLSGQPNNDGSCVLLHTTSGRWYDRGCNYAFYFFCYEEKVSVKKILRLEFKANSVSTFNDSALAGAILNKIQQEYNGLRLYWRVQPDGKIFHKKDKAKINEATSEAARGEILCSTKILN